MTFGNSHKERARAIAAAESPQGRCDLTGISGSWCGALEGGDPWSRSHRRHLAFLELAVRSTEYRVRSTFLADYHPFPVSMSKSPPLISPVCDAVDRAE